VQLTRQKPSMSSHINVECITCKRQLTELTQSGQLRHMLACRMDRHNIAIELWLEAAGRVYDSRLADRMWLSERYKTISVVDLAKELECSSHIVSIALKRHEIKRRSRADVRKLAQPQIEATCLTRYGVDAVFKRPDIIAKVTQGFLRDSKGRWISKLNRKAYDVLRAHNISFEPEFILLTNSRLRVYDIRVGKVLIELNGDFWHANPSKYAPNDVIKFPRRPPCFASDLWSRDAQKVGDAIKQGYRVVTLWEQELKLDFERTILNALA
jgi:hypothetical protein